MKTFIIDGSNFNDWKGFTKELYSQFGVEWHAFGLNWLDDILYGSVVGFEEDEEVGFVWKNSKKSRIDLDKDNSISLDKNEKSLYQIIIDTIRKHDNIHLRLE